MGLYEDSGGVLWGLFEHAVKYNRSRVFADGSKESYTETVRQYDWICLRDVCLENDQSRNAEEAIRATHPVFRIPSILRPFAANRTLGIVFFGAVLYVVLVFLLVLLLLKKKKRKEAYQWAITG